MAHLALPPLRLLLLLALFSFLLVAALPTCGGKNVTVLLHTVPASSVCSWRLVTNTSILNITLTPAMFQLAGPMRLVYVNSSANQPSPKLVWTDSNLTTIPQLLSSSGTYTTSAGTVDLGHLEVFNVTADIGGLKLQPRRGGNFGPTSPARVSVTASRVNGTVLGTYYSQLNKTYDVPPGYLKKYAQLSGKYTTSADGGVTLALHKTFHVLINNLVGGYGIPASAVPPDTYGEVVFKLKARGYLPASAPAPAPAAALSLDLVERFEGK